MAAIATLATAAAPAGAAIIDEHRWDVCGGNAFNTCSSVIVSIDDANKVTMQVWNLSGMYYAGAETWGATVFTKIGFFNTGGALVDVSKGIAMSGPTRGDDDPAQWQLADPNSAGGISLELVTSANGDNSGVDNGIANACQPGDLPGGQNQLWQNPCVDGLPLADDAGWITLQFHLVDGSQWDLAGSGLLIMGQNGPDGASTQCIAGGGDENCAVVPEPLTMALLGTGLAGVGGVQALGRWRGREDEEEDGPTT